MKKVKIIFTLFGMLLINACTSDELNREKAKNLILNHYNFPNVEFAILNTSKYSYNELSSLFNLGLIRKPITLRTEFYPVPTDEGKKFNPSSLPNYRNTFATNLKDFEKITGIVFLNEDQTKAKIEFNIKRNKITPFGTFFKYSEGDLVQHSVEAAKYDDGWRITTNLNETEKISIDEIDFFQGKQTSTFIEYNEIEITKEELDRIYSDIDENPKPDSKKKMFSIPEANGNLKVKYQPAVIVIVDVAVIRNKPSLKGKKITTVLQHQTLEVFDVSQNTSKIKVNNQKKSKPWYKVQDQKTKKIGWIYGGCITTNLH